MTLKHRIMRVVISRLAWKRQMRKMIRYRKQAAR